MITPSKLRLVFRVEGNHGYFFKRFLFITLIMQMLNLAAFWFLLKLLVPYLLAQVMVIGAIFVANYIINGHYTFSDKN